MDKGLNIIGVVNSLRKSLPFTSKHLNEADTAKSAIDYKLALVGGNPTYPPFIYFIVYISLGSFQFFFHTW